MCGLKPCDKSELSLFSVTPCVGVWIETVSDSMHITCSESHPAWVCGLKHPSANWPAPHLWSHPAWVCGLKQGSEAESNLLDSHTLRGCVDWNLSNSGIVVQHSVSHPAWVCGLKPTKKYPTSYLFLSHPAWVCGLKLSPCSPTKPLSRVTPCVGVWIETRLMSILVWLVLSHPAWVCGLKQHHNHK